MGAEDNIPTIPFDTQLRMVLIKEKHLQDEYAYMKSIVASHEKELAWLTVIVAILAATNYYLVIKAIDERSK